MPVEIERKFLVTRNHKFEWRAGLCAFFIQQGYIHASKNKSVRVRTKYSYLHHLKLENKLINKILKDAKRQLEYDIEQPKQQIEALTRSLKRK